MSQVESTPCLTKMNKDKLLQAAQKKIRDLESILKETNDSLYHAEVAVNNLNYYSRIRSNTEILGIPDSIGIKELETTVIEILGSINVNASS